MSKYAIIDVEKIKKRIFNWKLERLIKKANKLNKLTKYKYMILMSAGKARIYRKADLKYMIKRRVFKKGTTIKMLEKQALYIT